VIDWSKIAILTNPTCIWRLHWDRPHHNFTDIFGMKKLGYRMVLLAWS